MGKESAFSYRAFGRYLGLSIMCVGFVILLPLLVLFSCREELKYARCFIVPGGLALATGYLLSFANKGRKLVLERQMDAVLVIVFWILAILLCGLPFLLTGDYTFTQAVFESTSGWSTTGLSIVDVVQAPKIILMYRSTLQYFGGMGIVLVMSTVLSGSGGMLLYNAEGHSDRLVPNLLESARLILTIYSGYITAGTLLYRVFGMSWFDAVNHSIAAVSTGGFSTHAESIGYYNSIPIEVVTIVLMILGNTGFLAHLYLIKGKFRTFLAYDEMRFFLFCLFFFIPFATFLLVQGLVAGIAESLRVAAFQVISALTTTGFQTISDFNAWSPPLFFIICLLMLIGGGIGSTAGGIKQYRVHAMLRTVLWSIRDSLSFNGTIFFDRIRRPASYEKMDFKKKTEILSFIALYLLIYIVGVLLLTINGVDIQRALFEFASAMGTVGLSCGIMVTDAAPAILWTGTIGMFLGRLEIYVFMSALHRIVTDCVRIARNRQQAGHNAQEKGIRLY